MPKQPESIYGILDEKKEEDDKEEIKDNASEYSGVSQMTSMSSITVATQDLGLNVR